MVLHQDLLSLKRIYLLYYARERNMIFLKCYQDIVEAIQNQENRNRSGVSVYIENAHQLLCDQKSKQRLHELLSNRTVTKLTIDDYISPVLEPDNSNSISIRNSKLHIENLASLMAVLRSLEDLNLKHLTLSGNLESLAVSVSSKLQNVEIFKCRLKRSEGSLKAFAQSLANRPLLEQVDIIDLSFPGEQQLDICSMVATICENKTLKKLSVSGLPNNDSSGFHHVCQAIRASASLQSVVFGDILTNKMLGFVAEIISGNQTLKELFITANAGEDFVPVLEALSSQNALARISIYAIPTMTTRTKQNKSTAMISVPSITMLLESLQSKNYTLQDININGYPLSTYMYDGSSYVPLSRDLGNELEFYLNLNRDLSSAITRKRLLVDEQYTAAEFVNDLSSYMQHHQHSRIRSSSADSEVVHLSAIFSLLSVKPRVWLY